MAERSEADEKGWDVGGTVLFLLGLCSLMAAVVGFSVWGKGRPIEMGIAAVAALVVMLLSKMDRVQLFEAGSVKLQLREAKRVVKEAQVSIQNVRSLAGGLSAITLEMLSIQGRWGSIPMPKRLEMKESIDAILDELGVERDGELWQASERFLARLEWDHLNKIRGAATTACEALHPRQSEEYKTLGAVLKSALQYKRVKRIESVKLHALLKEQGVASEEVVALIDDFEHFKKARKFRRPELWMPKRNEAEGDDAP